MVARAVADGRSVWRDPAAIALLADASGEDPLNTGALLAWLLSAGGEKRAVASDSDVSRLPTTTLAEPNGAECSICMEEYAAGDELLMLGCGDGKHRFHAACLRKWLTTCSASCPLCRAPLF